MPDYDLLISKIEHIVGREYLYHSHGGFLDFAVDGKVPRILVYPANSDEVSAILRVANEEEASICPWSQGTKIVIGNIPKSLDIILFTSRLNKVIEHDQGNLTVTVEPGVKLSELQGLLKGKKQFLPFDPMFSSRCSIGGVIASNSNGPRRLRYGSVRDLLIGIKAALPTGERIKAGGKVVKNVAGYDMCKLFVGSFGTLGIITEATFKLYPLPEVEKTVLLSFENSAQAFEFISRLLESVVLPTSLEALNYSTLKVLSKKIDISFMENTCCLVIRLEGFEESVKRECDEIRKTGIDYVRVLEGPEQEGLWTELSDFPSLAGANFRFKVSAPTSITFDVFNKVEEYSKNLGVSINLVSHAGSGIVYGFLSTEEMDKLIQFINELGSYVAEAGGYLVVESASTEIKHKVNIWGHLPGGVEIMRKIKGSFDPKGLMSPGRWL
ncbi:MAG: FAD-binding oxidoreductase [Thermodesulfobacteriota bacterium]